MRPFWLLPTVLASVLIGPAGARERYVATDFLPAVGTECARPDGGRRYIYPPNTAMIVRVEDRTAYDRPPTEAAPRPRRSEPIPRPAVAPDPAFSSPTPPLPPERLLSIR